MGFNDQAEKLAYAWRQLAEAPFDSEQYIAAYEYLDEQYVVNDLDLDQAHRLWKLDAERWRGWCADLGALRFQ